MTASHSGRNTPPPFFFCFFFYFVIRDGDRKLGVEQGADPQYFLCVSRTVIAEDCVSRASKPLTTALTTEARNVCVCFKTQSPESGSGVLLVTTGRGGIWLLAEHKAKLTTKLSFQAIQMNTFLI